MAALKAERDLLERQYREALAADAAADGTTATDLLSQVETLGDAVSPLQLEDDIEATENAWGLAQRFMELSAERDELRRENQELKLLESDEDEALSPTLLAYHLESVTLTNPMTSAEVAEIVHATVEEMLELRTASSDEYLNPISGRIRFSIEKLFPGRSASELTSKTWEIARSTTQFQELYSSNIGVLYEPLDPSSAWFDDELSNSWTDTFMWSIFKPVGARQEHCMVEIGGLTATRMTTQFWMLEAMLMSLRWENRVAGPVFREL
ncbi:hypothetical protein PybrP1_007506 [[Pythium] brassicae (nom. inval.)]|nr:hypothetical protein PybrP1_007506 [[Pythium] brassicae (nom. inval.)]